MCLSSLYSTSGVKMRLFHNNLKLSWRCEIFLPRSEMRQHQSVSDLLSIHCSRLISLGSIILSVSMANLTVPKAWAPDRSIQNQTTNYWAAPAPFSRPSALHLASLRAAVGIMLRVRRYYLSTSQICPESPSHNGPSVTQTRLRFQTHWSTRSLGFSHRCLLSSCLLLLFALLCLLWWNQPNSHWSVCRQKRL